MFIVEVVPAALLVIISTMVPESPRYLVANRRDSEALAIMQKIDRDVGQPEIDVIRNTVHAEAKPKLSDLRGPAGKVLPIVWVGIGLAALQQFVGINVIFYYGTTLWSAVGFTQQNSFAINVVATVVAILLIDRVGRKPLLLVGSVGMSVTLALLALMFASGVKDADGGITLPGSNGIIALIAANLYVVAFAISWGPVVWVLLGEMFNNHIRGMALAVGAMANWLANWLVTVSFPPMLSGLGPTITYGVYCLFALVSIFFVARLVHETKGRSLEQA